MYSPQKCRPKHYLLVLLVRHISHVEFLPAFLGVCIALWKVKRALGLRVSWRGLEATRGDEDPLTQKIDAMATRTVGIILLPFVIVYVFYQLVYVQHPSWYTYAVTSSSSVVYALGFVMLTPQLFLNHKLKSVAHLPWKYLVFRFVNTFIDDLFAFIIRMPLLARLGCFRDDVVFFIYLYQRWIYEVDMSRPMDGAGTGGAAIDRKDETKKDR